MSSNPVRLRYQTIEFDQVDIHVRSLRSNQEYSDPLGKAESLGISSAQWPLFGIVWESGQVLAKEMEHFDIQGKRILEVGCGIGLSSLLLNSRQANITATDYHPEAGSFLAKNATLNNGADIPFLRTDWKDQNLGLGKFDLIIGADILYEREHINLLSNFIAEHSNEHCEIILVDPGRGNHAAFSKKMTSLGYEPSLTRAPQLNSCEDSFKGVLLNYVRNTA